MEKIIKMLMKDYEGFVKPRLSLDFMPVDRAESTGMLCEKIGDIALTVMCVIESNEDHVTSIRFSQKLADNIGVSKETLMKDSLENMKKIASPVLMDLGCLAAEEPEKAMALVCMDQNYIAGAAVIMIPEFRSKIINAFEGKDFYIIPSSRKELILIKKEAFSAEPIKRMIEEVNNSDLVGDADFLSNNLFVFDTIKNQLSMCC